ncbi:hypothetical protein CEE94_12110 [Lactobacillus crispatus]|nr:hypothetical protein CEE94_12110 [Lactobacillus crispatus]
MRLVTAENENPPGCDAAGPGHGLLALPVGKLQADISRLTIAAETVKMTRNGHRCDVAGL